MKKRAFQISVACTLAAVAFTTANAATEGKAIRLATFDEPFNDPDDLTAKQLANTEGVSLSEAARRLRIMGDLGRLTPALAARFPNSFAGAEATTGSNFRVAVYGVAADLDALGKAARQLAGASELANVLEVRTAPVSAAEIDSQARGYLSRLSALGSQATVATNARTGQIKLLVQNPTAALAALVDGRLRTATGVQIEKFDGIALTATEVPGGQNYRARFSNGDTDLCTRGFNVKQTNGSLYGVTTAGHCENTGGTDETTGVALAFRQEWVSNGVDSQWHTFSGNTNYLLVPKFYNGSGFVTVTGASGVAQGQYVCKYGRSTGQTCGYTNPYTYADSYGSFYRMDSNSTYPRQSLEGDSGGPVYSGSIAVGQVHGRDGGNPTPGPVTNMYFTPLTAWASNNVTVGVTCYC